MKERKQGTYHAGHSERMKDQQHHDVTLDTLAGSWRTFHRRTFQMYITS
jgi:hypothetical protein